MNADVLVYTTNYCPYCSRAKQLLHQKKAPFREVNVEDKPEVRSWLVSASGQRTVPQVFINGVSVGGFTELAGLDRAGKLDAMLASAPPSDLPALPQ